MPPIRATYRLQLHAGFTFDDAAAIVGYLRQLGVSHVYASPYLQAAPGSVHGYDVVDHGRVNDELGGEAAHQRFVGELAASGMSHVLDIVPNHMAISGRENAWWWDVLENGPSSKYAAYFDIDWDPPERRLTTKVLVPVLGDHYGRVLEAGELQVVRTGGTFTVRYHDHEVPVSPRTLDDLLARAAERTSSDEFRSLAFAFGRLPHALATDRASVAERHRDKEVLRARLDELLAANDEFAVAVDGELKAVNEDPDMLDELLARQNYRLAFWRTAGRELDYRRFFDITSLVALRVEDEQVFHDTHATVLALAQRGDIDGVRIDHVDGLRDPARYLDRLRGELGTESYIAVEKILEGNEELPAWPVDGTSGYDFLADASTVLVDPEAEDALTGAYTRFGGDADAFADVVYAAKHEVMRTVLAADVERLTELFVMIAEGNRRHRDYTRSQLRDALRETIAAFDAYRTYVRPGDAPSDVDVARVGRATNAAAVRRPDLEPELFRFLGDVLLLRQEGQLEAELAVRFQQVTSPVTAKAIEDTAFYRYLRFVALNEVGGDPSRFGLSVDEFHRRRAAAHARMPRSMLATSTHDTKRSEDVRARLAVLAEIPGAWEEAVWRWAHGNGALRRDNLPDRNAEYLLYQSLVGAWPISADRLVPYMEKAVKEAKVHTSWIDPVPDYDDAVRDFTAGVLARPEFVEDVERFLHEHRIIEFGRHNSLVQTALKLTCPGVPDIYQGSELWDLSLVDPDNRRPVDYDVRRAILEDVDARTEAEIAALLADDHDPGTPKLWLVRRLLRLRCDRPELFMSGYEPLAVEGPDAERVIAFARASGALVVVCTRFPARGPLDGRTEIRLPNGSRRAAVDVLGELPVAVLT